MRETLNALAEPASGGLSSLADGVWSRVAPQLVVLPATPAERAGRSPGRFFRPVVSMVVVATLVLGILHAWSAPTSREPAAYFPPNAPLADGKTPPSSAHPGASLPAPPPFLNPFKVVADPYPVSVGQTVSLVSEGSWPGRWVWLYGVAADQQSTLFYDRKLPQHAILIARVPIVAETETETETEAQAQAQAEAQTEAQAARQGHWAFSWEVPTNLVHAEDTLDLTGPGTNGDTLAYLAAVTDTGYLAATGLPIGPRRTLVVQPDPVKVGEQMTITGADYPPGVKVRLDLYHNRPAEEGGGTYIAVTLGTVTTDAGGAFTFGHTMPAYLNWAFADNRGQMVDHPLTVTGKGQFSIVAVEIHEDTGLRRAMTKRFAVALP